MNLTYIFIAIIVIAIALFLLITQQKRQKKNKDLSTETTEVTRDEIIIPSPLSFSDRLKNRPFKISAERFGESSLPFSGGFNDEKSEALEELLYGADIGTATVSELMNEVHKKRRVNFRGSF